MSFRQLMTLAVVALASVTNAAGSTEKGVEVPPQQPLLGTDTVAGCYSSLGELKMDSTDKYNAQGYCAPNCRDKGYPVGATYAKACWCGKKLPNKKTLADDKKCNEPCPGFDQQACGGLNHWTVYNTGVQVNVEEAELDVTSTTSNTPTSTPTSQTTASNTPTSPAESQKPEDDKSGSNTSQTVGIAVGVVAEEKCRVGGGAS
ncbi:hypothetical protein NUW58_g10594 [Xylaria curta]|uniref:Uncharacterized protein n=1 Tax=Xylaria curta TaxID=42375 RepID=A0ACC1MK83_9PEZI|nr:hypothetical protein NUW58_g10594 [Xylaria curta]